MPNTQNTSSPNPDGKDHTPHTPQNDKNENSHQTKVVQNKKGKQFVLSKNDTHDQELIHDPHPYNEEIAHQKIQISIPSPKAKKRNMPAFLSLVLIGMLGLGGSIFWGVLDDITFVALGILFVLWIAVSALTFVFRQGRFVVEMIIIFIIFFGIRSFVATPFQVDGHSMDDTLHDQEKIFINRLPVRFESLERGDIIVFKPPYFKMMPKRGPICFFIQRFTHHQDCGTEPQHYVKRIIGMPGDSVKIQEGKVFLKPKGEQEFTLLSEPYLNAENTNNTCFTYAGCRSEKDLRGYEFVVPEQKVFVLGDNRSHSTDSRAAFNVGSAFHNGVPDPYVPFDHIVGNVKVVIWPPDKWEWL